MITSNAKNLNLTAPGITAGNPKPNPIAPNKDNPQEAQPVNTNANTLPTDANNDPLVRVLLILKLIMVRLIVNADIKLIPIFSKMVAITTLNPNASPSNW